MHFQLSTWLVAPAILLPTVTAFYPYQYGDDSTPRSRTRSTSQLSSSNSSPDSKSITLPLRRIPTPMRPRQNAYNIVNSKDPTQENSVAIDQDGNNLSYMVAVTFGDSKEEYHLLLDSAASDTWVMGQDCKSDACSTHTLFGSGDSSTLKIQTDLLNVTYGTGTVIGTLAQDTFHMGPLSVPLTFGLATNVSQEFKLYPMDGILGIGRGGSTTATTTTTTHTPQIMQVLSSSRLIGAKLYGIHLSRGAPHDGELNLGAPNPSRFTGDLNWSDCLASGPGFWEIPLSDAGTDGHSAGLTDRTAIIDTGTSFILMPPADAAALHASINGSTHSGETFSVPCDTTAVMHLSFNNVAYNISTDDWRGEKLDSGLCRSRIIGRQTFNSSQWLVGDVFLRNVYSVFDFDHARVGFGVKQEGEQSTTTSSSSSLASSATATATATTLSSSSLPSSQEQKKNQSSGVVSIPLFSLWTTCISMTVLLGCGLW